MRKIVRIAKHSPKQSVPVTPDICTVAARVCRLEDSAWLALLHGADLRVLEAAALARSDVEVEDDRSAGIVNFREGKVGARIVATGPCAVRALELIRPAGGGDAPMFKVGQRQLERRMKRPPRRPTVRKA